MMIAVLSVALLSCSKPDVSERCAEALAASARAGGVEAHATGRQVTLSGTTLTLDARIENEQQSGATWLTGIAVAASPDSGASLTAGSVGVGATQAEALDTAIAEWVQLAGVAIVRALVLKEKSSERHTVAGFIVYPGATGIRGAVQPVWPKEQHVHLLGALLPVLGSLDTTRPHSLSLTLVVDPGSGAQGEVRFDGALSPAALDAAREFPWPALTSSYMFKQYYVIEGAR